MRTKSLDLVGAVLPGVVFAENWPAVTGTDQLSAIFSDTVMEAPLGSEVTVHAIYNADGIGVAKTSVIGGRPWNEDR